MNSTSLTTDQVSRSVSGTASVCFDGLSNEIRRRDEGIFGTGTSTALFTILVLVVIVLAGGGKIFGGYSNYPGYGGFSEYGYTVPRHLREYKYKYNPYDIYDD